MALESRSSASKSSHSSTSPTPRSSAAYQKKSGSMRVGTPATENCRPFTGWG